MKGRRTKCSAARYRGRHAILPRHSPRDIRIRPHPFDHSRIIVDLLHGVLPCCKATLKPPCSRTVAIESSRKTCRPPWRVYTWRRLRHRSNAVFWIR